MSDHTERFLPEYSKADLSSNFQTPVRRKRLSCGSCSRTFESNSSHRRHERCCRIKVCKKSKSSAGDAPLSKKRDLFADLSNSDEADNGEHNESFHTLKKRFAERLEQYEKEHLQEEVGLSTSFNNADCDEERLNDYNDNSNEESDDDIDSVCHWNDTSVQQLLQDIEDPLPEPHTRKTCSHLATTLIQWFCFFLLYWQLVCHISDNGLEWFLRFQVQFLQIIKNSIGMSEFLREVLFLMPTSVYMMRKIILLDRDNFTKYIVCPKCYKLYSWEQCLSKTGAGNTIANRCNSHVWRQPCGSKLVKEVMLSDGTKHFYPLKVFCYQSIINQLESLLKRPGVPEMCEQWRVKERHTNIFRDIFDGDIWKNFTWLDGSLFFSKERHYGLMLNVDWFQPFKHRSDYSVGVMYFVLMNLPRHERFRYENVIIGGIIPAMEKEPKLNTFLEPAVTELKCLWKGIKLLNSLTPVPLTFVAALLCVASDIPATRKICGFKGHAANMGCSKCKKQFPGGFGNKDYSGFDRSTWPKRTKVVHNNCSKILRDCTSKTEYERLSKEYGTYYSVLTELSYFDAIKFHVVDPMHNLFLGIAKKTWKHWMENVLSKAQLIEINRRIENLNIATDVGRIGKNISSNYGTFTAQEWKNWTVTYSMYVLSGILPFEHLRLWERFVLACRLLCQRVITKDDVIKADGLLLNFCKGYEKLYGKHAITPNLHLCCHLRDCIFNYGPIYSFWCFSFERYNGEIGSTITNNRSVEIQYMRKFVTLKFVNPLSNNVPLELKEHFKTIFHNGMERMQHVEEPINIVSLITIPFNNVLDGFAWGDINHIVCSREHKEGVLRMEEITWLFAVYKLLYPSSSIVLEDISRLYKQYKSISLAEERFGSKRDSHTCRSARILAIWAGEGGVVDLTSNTPRPGEVIHFLQHNISIDGKIITHIFAFVRWYKPSVYTSEIASLSFWKSGTFEPDGESSFLPVQRVCCRIAAGFIEKGHTQCFIPCPLSRKLCE